MRKLGFIIVTLLGIIALSSSFAYSKKCKVCQKGLEDNKTRYYYIGLAHIDFSKPYKVVDGKVYALYRCEYGHSWWECLGDAE